MLNSGQYPLSPRLMAHHESNHFRDTYFFVTYCFGGSFLTTTMAKHIINIKTRIFYLPGTWWTKILFDMEHFFFANPCMIALR